MKILTLLLFLFSSATSAMSLTTLNGQCGKDVRVYMTNIVISPAQTGIDDHGEYIAIDAAFFNRQTDNAIWFVFFHECGHRKSRHDEFYKPIDREIVADCYAVRRFIRSFGKQTFFQTLIDLKPDHDPHRENRILTCLY